MTRNVSWVDGTPQSVIDRIEALRSYNEEGVVQYGAVRFTYLKEILLGTISFPSEIPESEARRALWNALIDVGQLGHLTPEGILQALEKWAGEYLSRDIENYVLLSSLSILHDGDIPDLEFIGRKIEFGKMTDELANASGEVVKSAKRDLFSDPPTNYHPVRVYVGGRSAEEAAQQALSHLDMLRAVWNLYLVGGAGRITYRGKPKPANVVVAGPIHTLHEEDGMSVENHYLCDQLYIDALEPRDIVASIGPLLEFTRQVDAWLQEHPYRASMEMALLRYVRALDERDWDSAFLRLWGVLELLTHTEKASYTVTIRRAAYLFSDRDYHRDLLEVLRRYRNSYVHRDESNSGVEKFLYLLNKFVVELFRFHLENRLEFSSLGAAGEFLDLPYRPEDLVLRKELANVALGFREDVIGMNASALG